MKIAIGTLVTLPGFEPYPRYGVVREIAGNQVTVADVHCGDPRCPAEHAHASQSWPVEELEGANAYQPRAAWERGRKGAPNAPVAS